MRVINTNLPRQDRAEIQLHLDSLNGIIGLPDLNQMSVLVAFNDGTAVYKLDAASLPRVLAKLGELVSHQLPSPTSPTLPSVAPSVKAACTFFGIALPAAPTGSLDVADSGIDRP